jgi:hypothetical protein
MVFANKCLTRAAAELRYGHIDLANKFWPNSGKWMKTLAIPGGWFPNWYAAETKSLVTHIYANVDIHEPFIAALTAVHQKGLGRLLHTYDGCWNIRATRGSQQMSAHAYGLAVDLNAAENPLRATSGGFYNHPDFIECFTHQGFDSGCYFTHRKDPMHVSFCWE